MVCNHSNIHLLEDERNIKVIRQQKQRGLWSLGIKILSMSRIHNIHTKLKEAEKNTKKNPHSQGEKQHIIAKQIALMKKNTTRLKPENKHCIGQSAWW